MGAMGISGNAQAHAPWWSVVMAALGALLLMSCLSGCAPEAGQEAPAEGALVDLRGRPIALDKPATRLAIDDSRYLVALGLLHPDPVSLLVAWPKDINRLGPETYAQFLRKSPALADLPKIGSSAGAFDAESLLAAHPDTAILSLESGVTDSQIAQLEQAGIKVVVLDFFQKPFEHLEKSLLLLGKITGREAQAREQQIRDGSFGSPAR